jgi:hypothetical protein
MLLLAAAAHDTASIPLLIIGSAWLVMGIAALLKSRHLATKIQFASGAMTFVSVDGQRTIEAESIEEISRSRWDFNRLSPIRVRTAGGEVVKIAPRMTGLFEVLAQLREVNPRVKVGDL